MTREDAILHMILRREELKRSVGDLDEDIKAFDMAIEALEQEPCKDAISRSEVLDLIDSKDQNYEVRHFKEDVECLPSVTPQPKTGRWIHWASGDDCSECGWSTGRYIPMTRYCPNCGCRMIEPQESEDAE